MFRLLPDYHGPRPAGDDFIPYDGDLNKLDGPRDRAADGGVPHGDAAARRRFFGLGGMTTAAHTEEDVERTVAAVAAMLELLEGERPV